MKRPIFLLTFSTLAAMALFVSRSDATPETVRLIVPGVWFREGVPISHNPSRPEEMGNPNAIIIEMKDYLIVVDANYPSGARATMADIKKVSSKPVRYVFDTHHHGDHAYGNPLWTQAGATTFAYKGVADEMRRYEPARWRADASRVFVETYFAAAQALKSIPPERSEAERVLNFFLLEKALYEVAYELANRPDWVEIPLQGVVSMSSDER